MTRFQRLSGTASILASIVVGVGGTAFAAPEQAQAESADAAAAHGPQGHHGGRHHDLIRAALRLESLSASQRQQILALVTQERSTHANVRAARAQLLQAVAAGVDAGKVDPQSVEPRVSAVVSAELADNPADRAAVEKLHAVLTAAQRTELVDRVSAPHAGPRPDFKRDGGAGEHRGGPLGELNLTDTQRQQIESTLHTQRKPMSDEARTALQAEHEMHARMVQAFKNDRFVMNELVPPPRDEEIAREVEHMVTMAKVAAPILSAEQRSTESARLRAMAMREAK